jgi:hypothetical protein
MSLSSRVARAAGRDRTLAGPVRGWIRGLDRTLNARTSFFYGITGITPANEHATDRSF